MRIFVHSADSNLLRQALESGYIYGVTTNPTVLRRAGVMPRQVATLVQQTAEWGAHEIHLHTYSEEVGDSVREGRELAAFDPQRVVIRLPATSEGYAAARQLGAEGIRVSLSAVYTLRQVLLAQSVGASYVSVFLKRMNDAGMDGMTQIAQMQQLLVAQRADVTVMAASMREPVSTLEKIGMLGVGAATLAPGLLNELLDSPATAQAVSVFREDAAALLTLAEVGGE